MKIKSNRGKAVYIQPPLISKEDWHKDKVGLARLYGEDFVGPPHYDSSSESSQVAKEFELICNKLTQLNHNLNSNNSYLNIRRFKDDITERVRSKSGKFDKCNDKQIKAFKIDLEILVSNLARTQDKKKLNDFVQKLGDCDGGIIDTVRMMTDEYTTPCGLWPALTKIRVKVKDMLPQQYSAQIRLYAVDVHLPIIFANLAEFYGIPMIDTPIEKGVLRFPDGYNSVQISGTPGNVFVGINYYQLGSSGVHFVNNFDNKFFDLFDTEVVGGLADNLESVIKEKFDLAVKDPATLLDNLRALLLNQYKLSDIHENFLLAPMDVNDLEQPPKLQPDRTLRYWCHALSAHALELNGVAEPYPRTQINVDPQLDLIKLEGLEYFVSGNRILHPCEVIALGAQQGLLDKIMAALNESPKIFYFEMTFALELARQAALDNGEEFKCQTTIHDLLFLVVEFGTSAQLSDLASLDSFATMRAKNNKEGQTVLQSMFSHMEKAWEKHQKISNQKSNITVKDFAIQFTDEDLNKLAILIAAEDNTDTFTKNPALVKLAWAKMNGKLLALIAKNTAIALTEPQISAFINLALLSDNIDLFENCIKRNPSRIDDTDPAGMTMLHHAANLGRVWAIMKLPAPFLMQLINIQNQENKTALQLAIENGHTKFVELLLKCPDLELSTDRTRAYFEAAQSFSRSDILVLLIDKFGADPSILDWGIEKQDFQLLLILAQKNTYDKRVFDLALKNSTEKWMKIARTLLNKVDLTINDFYIARSIGQTDLANSIMKMLLTAGIVPPERLLSDFEFQFLSINSQIQMINHLARSSLVEIQSLPISVMREALTKLQYPLIIKELNNHPDELATKIRFLIYQSLSAIDELLNTPDFDQLYALYGHLNLCKLAGIVPNSGAALKLYAHSIECELRRNRPSETEHPKLLALTKGIGMPMNDDTQKRACNATLIFALNCSDRPEFSWFTSTPRSLTQLPEPLKERFFKAVNK